MTTHYRQVHFKTLEYQPEFPKRLKAIDEARTFCRRLAAWYNEDHHHAGTLRMAPHQNFCVFLPGLRPALVNRRSPILQLLPNDVTRQMQRPRQANDALAVSQPLSPDLPNRFHVLHSSRSHPKTGLLHEWDDQFWTLYHPVSWSFLHAVLQNAHGWQS